MILLGFIFETWFGTLAAVGAAVAVPVIIHLLNRRRFRVVTWAAMRFLLEAQRKNSRRMRLEQLLLLIVRCLLVALLVCAMASVMPWAETLWHRLFPEDLAASLPVSSRTHKIIVLDGSFSMAAKPGDNTAFERGKAIAEQIVRESARGDAFNVILMASPPRRIVAEPSEDGRKVVSEVQAVKLPHGNADVFGTLSTVEDLLRHSPGKFADREVYFITDLQTSTWIGRGTGAQQSGFVTLVQKIQSMGRTVFVDVGQEVSNNLAVTSLALGAPMAATGTLTPITATIHNYGPETKDQVRVELWIGKGRAATGDPPLDMRVAHQLVVRLNRGQNTISFPYKFTAPGEYVVQVRLENDALDLDDTRSAVLSVKPSVPVLLVNGKIAEGRGGKLADEATEWLRLALDPFDGKPGYGGIPARPKVITESEFNDVNAGDLTPYDCVFFCDVKQFTGTEVKRIETHLRRGGGAVFAMGNQVDITAYNDLLYRNGNGILPARLIGKQEAPKDWFFHLGVDGKAYTLPPLDAFTEDDDRNSLLASRFRQYLRSDLAPRGGPRKVLFFLPELAPGLKPPAKDPGLPTNDPALVEWQPTLPSTSDDPKVREKGQRVRGRVMLVTTTLNMDWTTWPASPSYLAFMQELLGYSIAGRLREQAVTVGDPLEEYLQATGGGLDASVATPDGRTEAVKTLPHEDVSVVRWADTDISGVYRLTVGQHPQDHLFAVNVPPSIDNQAASESDPTRTTPEELKKNYPDWEFQVVGDLHDIVRSGSASATQEPGKAPLGRAIAWCLLIGVLSLLLLEVVLAWRFGHWSTVSGAHGTPPATGKLLPILSGTFAALIVGVMGFILIQAVYSGDFLSFLPDGVRSGFERLAGIPAPAAGEGSRWRLEFLTFFVDGPSDVWLAGFVAVAAVVLVVWIYTLEGPTASTPYKLLMAGMRLSMVFLTLTVLLPRLQLWFERQGFPDVAIILDDSQSMSTVDAYRDPRVREVAEQLAKSGELSEPQRLQLAQALLTRGETDWLTRMLQQRKVKLHVYHASARAHRVADVTSMEDVGDAVQKIRELSADPKHDSSQLGTAVRQVINDFRGSSLAAIVTLTDGVTTEGEDLVKVSTYAKQVGVPLFFVGIGDNQELRDLALSDLQAEDSVYVKDRIVFEMRLTGTGYSDLLVPVRLREKGKEKILDEKKIKVDPSGKPVKVRLVHQPEEAGEKVFVIDVPVQPDEKVPENNKLERTVFVRDAKLIKVLYVEGYPRYEYRFIKTLLERESARQKGNKSIDLKVLLLDADPDFAAEDKSAISEFPTKTELTGPNGYDVVILGDVDPKHVKVGDKNLLNLAEFVKERGGGLLTIAGPRSMPHLYKDTPLRDILPIDVVKSDPPEEPAGGRIDSFHPDLTAIGRLHPIFRFSPDEGDNDKIWTNLREMYWWSEGYRLKPAAEVLAVHPRVKGRAEDKAMRGEEGHPLVVQHFVGSGRSMFFGFEETWRWRFREDELRFNQFWVQTIRYLARSRLGRIDLRLDKQTPYHRGEPIKMTVRFPDDAAPPGPEVEVKVVVERRPPRVPGAPEEKGQPAEVQTVQLARLENSRSTFEGMLTRTPEGEYQFWLSTPEVKGQARPRAECRVLAPPGETELLRMNQPDMERAAEETQGRFYSLADADKLIADLPAGTRVSLNSSGPPWVLWNNVGIFLIALMFLTSEWVLRKRKHLL